MKVLYVSNYYPPYFIGGAELIAHQHVKQLKLLGCKCAVFAGEVTGGSPPMRVRQDVFEGIQVFRVAIPERQVSFQRANFYNHAIERHFVDVLECKRPDLVHFHNLPGLSVDLIDLARKNGCATVLTVHDHWGFCHRQTLTKPDGAVCTDFTACSNCLGVYIDFDKTEQPIGKRNSYVRERLRRLDLLISPSQYLADQYIFAGYAPKQTAVLGNGVDLASFIGTNAPLAASHEVRFGIACCLEEHKGVRHILDAIAALPQETRAKFYFAGKGPLDHVIVHFINNNQNGNRVNFCGAFEYSAMNKFYRSIDVFVSASQWPENQPLTIMEAMASGVAVIAPDIGGITEMVRHGSAGLITPVRDVSALASAFQAYANDPKLAKLHGQAGQRTMSQQSIKKTALRLYNLYNQLTASKKHKVRKK